MITVIGKLADTQKYIGVQGYNVLPKLDNWTPDMNLQWIRKAIERGDDFLIVSTKAVSGFFVEEVDFLLCTLKKDNHK